MGWGMGVSLFFCSQSFMQSRCPSVEEAEVMDLVSEGSGVTGEDGDFVAVDDESAVEAFAIACGELCSALKKNTDTMDSLTRQFRQLEVTSIFAPQPDKEKLEKTTRLPGWLSGTGTVSSPFQSTSPASS